MNQDFIFENYVDYLGFLQINFYPQIIQVSFLYQILYTSCPGVFEIHEDWPAQGETMPKVIITYNSTNIVSDLHQGLGMNVCRERGRYSYMT